MIDDLIGKTLGGYRIEKRLARSALWSVYRATQLSVDRPVAMRVLSAAAATDRERVRAFLEAARRAGRVKHAGLVEIHEVRQVGDLVASVLEYLPGGSLESRIAAEGPIPWRRAARLLAPIIDALRRREGEGSPHGQLGSDRLLFAADGRLKVLHDTPDPFEPPFLSEPWAARAPAANEAEAPAPRLLFAAPERLRGAPADSRSDVYSLGCVFWHALTGRRPFAQTTAADLLSAKRLHQVPPLETLRPDLPRDVRRFVETLMERRPERRLPSFAEVDASLRRLSPLAEGKRGAGRGAVRIGRRVFQFPAVLGDAAGLLVAALVAVLAVAAVLGRGGSTAGPVVDPASGPPAAGEGATRPADVPVATSTTAPPKGAPSKGAAPSEEPLRAAVEAAVATSRRGAYREAVVELDELARADPRIAPLAGQARDLVLSTARVELDTVSEQASGHLALGEETKAEDVLLEIIPRLPPPLDEKAASSLHLLRRDRWERDLRAGLGSFWSACRRLELDDASASLESLAPEARAIDPAAVYSAEEALRRLDALHDRLEAAFPSATAVLADRMERSRAAGEPSFERLRAAMLQAVVEIQVETTAEAGPGALVRGKLEALADGRVRIVYGFEAQAEAEDFVPASSPAGELAVRDGRLELRGECRLLGSSPFVGPISVRLLVPEYDGTAPNVNLAVWTAPDDAVTYSGDANAASAGGKRPPGRTDSGGPASEGPAAQGRWDWLVLGFGYQPEQPLVASLRSRAGGGRVIFPCVAVLGGRTGRTLHGDLDWDCEWASNYLREARGPLDVRFASTPGGFEWEVDGRRIDLEIPKDRLERIVAGGPARPAGSVTLFTNGRTIAVDSLEVTGALDPGWSRARIRDRVLATLEAAAPDLPWRSAVEP